MVILDFERIGKPRYLYYLYSIGYTGFSFVKQVGNLIWIMNTDY